MESSELFNPFKLLGVAEDATIKEIKAARNQAALEFHPDRHATESADKRKFLEDQFKKINQAYDILSNPEKRKLYTDLNASDVFDESINQHRPALKGAGLSHSHTFRVQHKALCEAFKKKPLPSLKRRQLAQPLVTPDLAKIGRFFEEELKQNTDSPHKSLYEDLVKTLTKVTSNPHSSSQKQSAYVQEQADLHWSALQKVTAYLQQLLSLPEELTFLLDDKHFSDWATYALERHCYADAKKSISQGLRAQLASYQSGDVLMEKIQQLKSRLHRGSFDKKQKATLYLLAMEINVLIRLENFFIQPTLHEKKGSARYYREMGFLGLDWLPALGGQYPHKVFVNLFLRLGLCFQLAASAKEAPPEQRMADHQMAEKMYMSAWGLACNATPDVFLSCVTCLLKQMPSWAYKTEHLDTFFPSLHRSAKAYMAFYPLAIDSPKTADVIKENALLKVIRSLLKMKAHDVFHNRESIVQLPLSHREADILYQAYVAAIKGWYERPYSAKTENRFRLYLMEVLLEEKGWDFNAIEDNIAMPATTLKRTPQGWLKLMPVLSVGQYNQGYLYSSFDAIRINETGAITLLASPCHKKTPDCYRTFNLSDINDIMALNTGYALFSLNGVDPDKRYHPFNTMRFFPKRVRGSQLAQTLLATDYLLKMLTTAEVQGTYPYDFRPLDQLLSPLPDYLKKVILDFRERQHSSAPHRFWIEAITIDVGIENEKQTQSIRFSTPKMAVRKHKMRYDEKGNLIDDEQEGYEGWHCYFITPAQKEAFANNLPVLGVTAPAILLREGCRTIRLLTEDGTRQQFDLKAYDAPLRRFFTHAKKIQKPTGEIADEPEISGQRYLLIKKVCEQSGVPTFFSPEYIFAQEFTRYYDEFAHYLPDFNRLKALCTIMVAIRQLSKMMEQSKKMRTQLLVIEKDLEQFKELKDKVTDKNTFAQYYPTLVQDAEEKTEEILKLFHDKERKNELLQEERDKLLTIRKKIGSFELSPYSEEVEKGCQEFRKMLQKQSEFSADRIEREIKEQRTAIAKQLGEFKKTSACQQLKEIFTLQLPRNKPEEIDRFVNDFIAGKNITPLAQRLVDSQLAQFVKELGGGLTVQAIRQAVGKKVSAVKKITQQFLKKSMNYFYKKNSEQIKADLKWTRSLLSSLKTLGVQPPLDEKEDEEDEKTEDTSCLWVPSVNTRPLSRHEFFVYGGVALNPKINYTPRQARPTSRPLPPLPRPPIKVTGQGAYRKVEGFQRHHIISDKNRYTKNYELIHLAGVNLQSSMNKIFLPKSAEHHPTRTIHWKRHYGKKYSGAIAEEMKKIVERGKANNWKQADYNSAYKDLVSNLRQELKKGNIKLNKHARPWAKTLG